MSIQPVLEVGGASTPAQQTMPLPGQPTTDMNSDKDIAALTAQTDEIRAVVADFVNLWHDLPPVVADFGRCAAARGLALSIAQCALVPLWCFPDLEVEVGLASSCIALVDCVVRGSAGSSWAPGHDRSNVRR